MSDPIEEGILDGIEAPVVDVIEPKTDENGTVEDDSAMGAEDKGAKPEDAELEDSPASDEELNADGTPRTKPIKGVRSRIDELVRKQREAERDRDFYRDMALKKGEEPSQTPKEPEKPVEEPEPQQEDFESFEEYVKANTRWEIRKATKESEQRILEDFNRRQESERRKATVEEKFESARKLFPDFDNVVNSTKTTDSVVEIVHESKLSGEIAYYLGKHPDILRRIERLSPINAAMEIGEIQARIQARLNEKSPPAYRKINASPEPQRPLGGGISTSTKDRDKMSHEEYRASREADLKKRR